MTKNRIRPDAGWVDRSKMPKGPNGKNLCRECGKECKTNRRTFCSAKCVDAWKIKSQPGYVRSKLRKRDRGVCAQCGLDTKDVKTMFSVLDQLSGISYYGDERKKFPELTKVRQRIVGILRVFGRTSYWDADHKQEVVDGGGECGLDNYETLCVWCHRAKSARKRKERAKKKG